VTGTDHHVLDLATLEQNERGDRSDPHPAGDHRVLFGVQFHEFDAPREFGRQGVDHRGQRLAGTAPWGPEIHQNRQIGLDDFTFERGIGNRNHARHLATPVKVLDKH